MNRTIIYAVTVLFIFFIAAQFIGIAGADTLGAWSTANNPTGAMYYGSCVVNNNNVYCALGANSTGGGVATNTVDTAPITNNVIGTWTTANSLPSAMEYGSCVVNNNNIYCALGAPAGFGTTTVDTAPITNNVIGTWTTANSLAADLSGGSCVVNNNNNIYCALGYLGNTVDTAPITNNVIGTWTTANSLTAVMTGGSCVVNNNNIYCVLGHGGTIVDTAPITNNVIGTWTAANNTTAGMAGGSCVVNNNNIYCALGYGGTIVDTAPITNNVIGRWTTANSLTAWMTGGSCVVNNNNIYCALGDHANTIDTAQITITPLSNVVISPSSSTIDSGQSITFTGSWLNGQTPYNTVLYSGSSSSCASDITSANVVWTNNGIVFYTTTFSPVSPTASAYYCVKVTDGSSATANSTATYVTVNPALSTTPTLTPSATQTLDSGQSETFSASWSGGTPDYTASLYSSSTSTCSSGSTLVHTDSALTTGSASFIAVTPTTTTYYCVVVTDSAPTSQTATSTPTEVVVNPALVAPSISSPAAATTLDVGQNVIVTASAASGGTGGYTYAWSASSGTSCPGFTAPGNLLTFTYTPTAAASCEFTVAVTDTGTTTPYTKTSASSSTITVNPALVAPSISSPAAATTLDVGQSLGLSAYAASGGTPNQYSTYAYSWNNSGSCPGFTPGSGIPSLTYTPTGPTTNCAFKLTATDDASTPAIATSIASPTITVNPALSTTPTLTPSATQTLDSGQSETFSASWSGGTPDYTASLYSSSTSPCSSGSTLVQTDSALTTGSASFTAVTPTTTTYYCVVVTDSATTSQTATSTPTEVVVNPPLVPPSISSPAAATTLDVGQNVIVTASAASGGTGGYTYAWSVSSGTSCPGFTAPGNLLTFTYTPTAAASCEFTVAVTDTGTTTPYTKTSSPSPTITVNPVLVAPLISSPAAATTLDVGQNVIVTASAASGGTGGYTYVWSASSGTSCPGFTAPSNVLKFTYTPNAVTSSCEFNVTVTDQASTLETNASAASHIITARSVSATTLSPPTNTLDIGQNVIISTTLSNGAGPFTANLVYSNNGVVANTVTNIVNGGTANLNFVPTYNGIFTFNVVVTDTGTTPQYVFNALGNSVINVNNAIAGVSLTVSNSIVDVGQSETIAFTWNGGMPDYSGNIVVSNSIGALAGASMQFTDISATTNTLSFTVPSGAHGAYAVTANVFDSATTAESNTLTNTLVANAIPTVTITPNTTRPVYGTSVKFTIEVLNGSGPTTVTLYNVTTATRRSVGNVIIASSGDTNTIVVTPATAASYSFRANATDNADYVFNSTLSTITAFTVHSGGGGGGLPTTPSVNTTTATTTTTSVNTTTATTTTIPQGVSSPGTNATVNVSKGRNSSINFTTYKLQIMVSVNSTANVNVTVNVVNTTRTAPPAPKNYLLINAYTITAANTVLTVTPHYPCNLPSSRLAPYMNINGAWTKMTPFTVNAAACTITFSVPGDPQVAILEAPAPPTNVSTVAATVAPTTIVSPLSSAPLHTALYAVIVIIIAIIIIVMVRVYVRQRNRHGGKR